MYQVFIKRAEPRGTAMEGPFSFGTAEERRAFVTHSSEVYWYHFAEEDDWNLWKRGGAWAATARPGPADRENIPPEITEGDRWLQQDGRCPLRPRRPVITAMTARGRARRSTGSARFTRAPHAMDQGGSYDAGAQGSAEEGQPGHHRRVHGRQPRPL